MASRTRIVLGLPIAVLGLVFAIGVHGNRAFANQMPDLSDDPGIEEEISAVGAGNTLDSEDAFYGVYSNQPGAASAKLQFSVTPCITNTNSACGNGSVAHHTVEIIPRCFNGTSAGNEQYLPDSNPNGNATQFTITCGSASESDAAGGRFEAVIEIKFVNPGQTQLPNPGAPTAGELYAFKIDSVGSNMLVGYDAHDQNSTTGPFAEQYHGGGCTNPGTDMGGHPGTPHDNCYSTFNIPFEGACTNDPSATGNVSWSDADGWNSHTPYNWSINFTVTNTSTNSIVRKASGQQNLPAGYQYRTGGQGDDNAADNDPSQGRTGSSPLPVDLPPNVPYLWQWNSVIYTNGIRFRIPSNALGLGPLSCPPKGNITSVICNAATGQYTINGTFSDYGYDTSAEITGQGGTQFGNLKFSSPATWIVNISDIPATSWPILLKVKDNAPGGSGNYVQVDSDGSPPSCPVQSSPTCGSIRYPGGRPPYVGSPLTFDVSVQPGSSPPANPGMNITVSGPTNQSYPNAGVSSQTNPQRFQSVDETFTPLGGIYTFTWQLTNGNKNNTVGPQCSATLPVGYVPYFDVLGGDIAAGPGFGTTCSGNASASIVGENLESGGQYFGAGSQLAALATGPLDDFVTDTTNLPTDLGGSTDGLPNNVGSLTAGSPSGLAFSNSSTDPSNSLYGGEFGHVNSSANPPLNWCTSDYVKAAVAAAGSNFTPITSSNIGNLSSILNGITSGKSVVYELDSSITSLQLPAIQLQPGVHLTIIVNNTSDTTNHNVYLNNNITYSTNYTKVTDIPQFQLLVKGGNISVDSNTATLDGFYDAQPSSTTGGELYTCATAGTNQPVSDYATCNHQLTFNGSVAAYQIVLGRTFGNIGSYGAAEHFVYNPELWLGSLSASGCLGAQTGSCTYQSYTSLPPVL